MTRSREGLSCVQKINLYVKVKYFLYRIDVVYFFEDDHLQTRRRHDLMNSAPSKNADFGLMKIGEFARLLNVTPRTIRYYESLGLIRPSRRSDGGFRLYHRGDQKLLLSIFALKKLGFSLDEIRKLAGNGRNNQMATQVFRALVVELRSWNRKLSNRIASLNEVRDEIDRTTSLLENCPGCDGKAFDAECVECWEMNGGVPLPLQVLTQFVEDRSSDSNGPEPIGEGR